MRSIHRAAAEGLFNDVADFLKNGVDPNITDEHGWTPLMYACRGPDGHPSRIRRSDKINEYENTVDFLISSGALIDYQDKKGITALMCSAMSGKADYGTFVITQSSRHVIAKKLINAGANKELKNDGEKTALDISREHRTPYVEALLLGLNKEETERLVDIRNFNNGKFKFELKDAIDKKDINSIKEFCLKIDKTTLDARRIEYRSNYSEDYTIERETILEYAIQSCASIEILTILLDAGALSQDGNLMALHVAVQYYSKNIRELLELLLRYGINLNAQNNFLPPNVSHLQHPLEWAVWFRKPDWVRALAEKGARIDSTPSLGSGAIDEAIERDDEVILKIFREFFPTEDYSINRRYRNGSTRLQEALGHFGWQNRRTGLWNESIDWMLKENASFVNKNNDGETIFTTLFDSILYFGRSESCEKVYKYFLNCLRSLLKINGALHELKNGKNKDGFTGLEIFDQKKKEIKEARVQEIQAVIENASLLGKPGMFSQMHTRHDIKEQDNLATLGHLPFFNTV